MSFNANASVKVIFAHDIFLLPCSVVALMLLYNLDVPDSQRVLILFVAAAANALSNFDRKSNDDAIDVAFYKVRRLSFANRSSLFTLNNRFK